MIIHEKYKPHLRNFSSLFVLLFCFVLKFIFIGKRDISIDEPFSIFHAQQSIREIITLSSSGEPNPPLFLLILHFWIKLFGNDVISVRLLPLIFNSITSVVIYQTGRKFINVYVGFASALIFIFSFYNFFHGLEVRTYSLFVMATALSLFYFLGLIKNKNNKNLIGLTLTNILLIYSHYFGWFIILTQVVSIPFFWKDRTVLLKVLSSIGTTILAFLPMFGIIINQFQISGKGTWLVPPVITDYAKEIFFLFNDKTVVQVIGVILVIGTLLFLFSGQIKKVGNLVPHLILFFWWFIPYTIMFLISFRLPIFNSRYILFTSVGLYLFSCSIVSILFKRNKFLEIIALSLFVITMAYKLRILPDDFGRREIKNTALFVKQEEKQLDDRIILLYPGWSDLPFMYYYNRSIFDVPDNFYENCTENNIYKVWNSANVKEIIDQHTGKDVLIVIDKSEQDTSAFFNILRSTHIQNKIVTFPETYTVGVFKSTSENQKNN